MLKNEKYIGQVILQKTHNFCGVQFVNGGELPTAPTKIGFTFGGWFTKANGGETEFTATSTVTESMTVYAKCTQRSCGMYNVGGLRQRAKAENYNKATSNQGRSADINTELNNDGKVNFADLVVARKSNDFVETKQKQQSGHTVSYQRP